MNGPRLSFPINIQRQIDAEMKNGETLLWAGRPIPPNRMSRLAGALFLFLMAAVFWMVVNHQQSNQIRKSWGFPIYTLPFVLLGVLALLGPAIDRAAGGWRLYVVTERRAIIFYGSRFGPAKVESYPLEPLNELSLVERPDKSGDLVFARYPGMNGTTSDRGFLRVQNVRDVDRLIRDRLRGKHLVES